MLEAIVGIMGTTMLAVIGWAININTKVAVLEKSDTSAADLIASKLEDIKSRLARIEKHVLNGHYKEDED